jgi:hypothetical protein
MLRSRVRMTTLDRNTQHHHVYWLTAQMFVHKILVGSKEISPIRSRNFRRIVNVNFSAWKVPIKIFSYTRTHTSIWAPFENNQGALWSYQRHEISFSDSLNAHRGDWSNLEKSWVRGWIQLTRGKKSRQTLKTFRYNCLELMTHLKEQ